MTGRSITRRAEKNWFSRNINRLQPVARDYSQYSASYRPYLCTGFPFGGDGGGPEQTVSDRERKKRQQDVALYEALYSWK